MTTVNCYGLWPLERKRKADFSASTGEGEKGEREAFLGRAEAIKGETPNSRRVRGLLATPTQGHSLQPSEHLPQPPRVSDPHLLQLERRGSSKRKPKVAIRAPESQAPRAGPERSTGITQ